MTAGTTSERASGEARTARPLTLVLASASPRRCELLTRLGLDFVVRPADLDETPLPREAPAAMVERLARAKATAAAHPGELVLAADTTVVVGGDMLAKPEDAADAARMLRLLSGRRHEVLTGVALCAGGDRLVSAVERTWVTLAPLSAREIDWYVASREPLGKAGAYAIQGLVSLFVTAIDGNYLNVVGLPLPLVYRLASALGFDLLAISEAPARAG